MPLRWRIRPHDQGVVDRICEANRLSPVIAQILAARELTRASEIEAFFDLRLTQVPGPFQLPGLEQACQAILSALGAQKKIVVYGDYDCDGITATAILYRCLKLLGAQVSYFVPSRIDDGYGLNSERLRELRDQGAELVITVDCGIASIAEAEVAREIGLELVITDHHQMGPTLPAAAAIVHPALPGGDYPFAGLCGAGVAFKLAWGLCQRHCGSEKLPEPLRLLLFQSLAFAAIGTVADVVPLRQENRILVHQGIERLVEFGGLGLKALLRCAKLDSRPKLGAEDIAFSLAPRLNASGRLGQAQLGVELLVTDNPHRAEMLAEYIDNLNKSRDSLERTIIRNARKQLEERFDPENDPAIVLADRDWHVGVIGIVAGRLAEEYHRPTVIISLDTLDARPAVGSARSGGMVDLYAALGQCQSHLIGYGGHRAAAGLKIAPHCIEAFREAFFETVAGSFGDAAPEPELVVDAEAALCQLTVETVQQLEKLAPFGQENPRPVICATGVQLVEPPKKMGSDGRHLALRVSQDRTKLRAVGFGKADWSEQLGAGEGQLFDFAFKPVINDFNGMRRVELQLIDFRPSRCPAPAAR
ncbi:MAG: single-stranded-DNA-specific exonuclease RecJ [Planctomycetota bacterium]|jgi:single-stranded-DNA-specific exonuclease